MNRVRYTLIVTFLFSLIFLLAGLAIKASAATPWGPMSEIEAAARKEGKLVIYSAPAHTNRASQRAISKVFQDKYGITIDWTTMNPQTMAPRILAEQRTKRPVVDVLMTGIAGNYVVLKSKGYSNIYNATGYRALQETRP